VALKQEGGIETMPVINASLKKATTFDNIQKQILCQIPGISLIAAKALYEHFHTINNMLKTFHDKEESVIRKELNLIKVNDRKISKRVVENLLMYLFDSGIPVDVK
jgi:ERCC4-type nuclease